MTMAVVELDEVERRLAALTTVGAAKQLRDQAEALRSYAKNARQGLEVQNRIALVKILAERRAGELLQDMEKHRGSLRRGAKLEPRTGVRLRDLGITKGQSHTWQIMAAVPEADVRAVAAERTGQHEELTSAEVYDRGVALRDVATEAQRRWDHLRRVAPDVAAAVDRGTTTLAAAEAAYADGFGQEAVAFLRAHHPSVAEAVAVGDYTLAEVVVGDSTGRWALTARGRHAVYERCTLRQVKCVFLLSQWRVVREVMQQARVALGTESNADLWLHLLADWLEHRGAAAGDVARLRACIGAGQSAGRAATACGASVPSGFE
jgi:hypothetical protein